MKTEVTPKLLDFFFFFDRQGQKNSFTTKESHLDPKCIQGIYKMGPETYKEIRTNKKTYQPQKLAPKK